MSNEPFTDFKEELARERDRLAEEKLPLPISPQFEHIQKDSRKHFCNGWDACVQFNIEQKIKPYSRFWVKNNLRQINRIQELEEAQKRDGPKWFVPLVLAIGFALTGLAMWAEWITE